MCVRDTLTGTSLTNRFRLGDPKAQRFLPIENGWQHAEAVEYVDDAADERKVFGGQNLISDAQLRDSLLLTSTRDLCNYVDVVSERLCWKDTEHSFRGV